MEAIARIERYTLGIDFATFGADEMRIDAVIRNLEIIGEATKNIPQAQRDLTPSIEWRKIAGLRDIVAHHYFNVNLTIIWDVIENYLTDVRQAVITLLGTVP